MFDLMAVKAKLTELLHGLEADLGPWAKKLEEAFHAVADHVHAQAVADAGLVVGQVKEDVKAAETAAETLAPAAPAPPAAP